jgi:hypothetical protein
MANQQKHSLQNFFKHTRYPGRRLSVADLENAKQNAVHLINAARTSPEALHEEAQRLFMPAARAGSQHVSRERESSNRQRAGHSDDA